MLNIVDIPYKVLFHPVLTDVIGDIERFAVGYLEDGTVERDYQYHLEQGRKERERWIKDHVGEGLNYSSTPLRNFPYLEDMEAADAW